MRDLRHQGIAWRVREMDAKHIPGARADRCLIFDSEGVVRRAWSYPRAWAELDDESIWALLDRELPAPLATFRFERRATARGDHATVVTAARVAANTRAFFNGIEEFPPEDEMESEDFPVGKLGRSRKQLRAAITNYASALRLTGTTPEKTIVLVKSAVAEGIEQAPECAEYITKDLTDDAVRWCIRAYYGG